MNAHKSFLAEIQRPADRIDIERCALLFASILDANVDMESATLALDDQVNGLLDQQLASEERQARNSDFLVRVVGGQLGYRGDSLEYFSPSNSHFDQVIENRLGIPISLAAIYISVGKRLGITVHGIGFPGHFLIRVTEPDGTATVIDPFAHRVLTKEEEQHLSEIARLQWGDDDGRLMANAHPHDVLVRMLENLKSIYFNQKDITSARKCLDIQLLIAPENVNFLQQLQTFIELTKKPNGRAPDPR